MDCEQVVSVQTSRNSAINMPTFQDPAEHGDMGRASRKQFRA